VNTSEAFGQEIGKYVKASSTDFATTPVDQALQKKELEQIKLDALVLIFDRVTALVKKDVLESVGSLENKVAYIQESPSLDTDKMMDMLVGLTEEAIEKKDLSYLVGLTEVMRHKDGMNIGPPEVIVSEDADKIFNRRNKLTDGGKKSLESIADWVKQGIKNNVEFIYYSTPGDIEAQERTEEIRREFRNLDLKSANKVSGYIDSNFSQSQKGRIKLVHKIEEYLHEIFG